jgi:hypothetical protein
MQGFSMLHYFFLITELVFAGSAVSIKRDGEKLSILYNAKPIKTFEGNATNGESFKKFDVVEEVLERSAVVVREDLYEGANFYLVLAEKRKTIKLHAAPVWSPSKQHFAVANVDLDAGYTSNAGQLWSCLGDGCQKELDVLKTLKLSDKSAGASKAEWDGNDKVVFSLREKLTGGRFVDYRADCVVSGAVWNCTR